MKKATIHTLPLEHLIAAENRFAARSVVTEPVALADPSAPFIDAVNAMMALLDLPASQLAEFSAKDEHERTIGFFAAMKKLELKIVRRKLEVSNLLARQKAGCDAVR